VKIKLDTDTIRYIGLFETMTKAFVKDCIPGEDKIVFVVKENNAKKAIGKKGVNVRYLQNALNKRIEIIEYSEDPLKFIRNIFRPAKMKEMYMSEKSNGIKVIHIAPSTDKGLVKSKLKTAKYFINKYYNIDEIMVH